MDSSVVFFTNTRSLGIARKSKGRIVVHLESQVCSENFQIEYNPEFNKLFDDPEPEEELTLEYLNICIRDHGITEKVVEIHKLESPGYYYPRVARENINFNYVTKEFLQDIRAFKNIQQSLDNLFNYIEPEQINLKTYSHKIRELLILSCTEAEYLMKKVLLDNGYVSSRLYTSDYFKCKNILKLGEYEVVLKQYTDLKRFHPFKEWTDIGGRTTSSIPWYQAYNAVKHDRGGNISQANLEHLLDAVAAIHILLESQYGRNIFNDWKGLTDDRSMFSTLNYPHWELSEITAPILKIPSYEVETEWIGEMRIFSEAI